MGAKGEGEGEGWGQQGRDSGRDRDRQIAWAWGRGVAGALAVQRGGSSAQATRWQDGRTAPLAGAGRRTHRNDARHAKGAKTSALLTAWIHLGVLSSV